MICSHNTQGYYKRTPEYIPTVRRERVGCFKVPVVHSAFLVDLRREESKRLVFWPKPVGFNGPVDDVVQFAYVANKEGGCGYFGFIPNLPRCFVLECVQKQGHVPSQENVLGGCGQMSHDFSLSPLNWLWYL